MRHYNRVFCSLLLACSIFVHLAYGEQAKPGSRTSYTESGTPQDVSYAGVKRVKAFIVVPTGRTEEEVRETLRQAAMTIGKREKAAATSVWAYRPQDQIGSGSFTVGSAIYAPNGRWEDAATRAPMSVTVELAKHYFQETAAANKMGKGQQAVLSSKSDKLVEISQKRDAWGQNDIIARIPQNTSVLILESYEKPLTASYMFVRYLVRVNWEGKTIEGWVHGDNLTKR